MRPMTKISYWIPIFLFLMHFELSAQSKINAWKVEYEMSYSGKDSVMMALIEAMTILNENEPIIRAYVTFEKLRVEQYNLNPYVQVSNLKDSVSFKYMTKTDDDFNQEKLAYEVPLAEPKINVDYLSDNEDPSIFISSDLVMTLSDETQTIAGNLCNLARFKLDDSNEILVWYVKDLPQLFWGEYDYLEKVPGLPLKIESSITDSRFNIGVEANSLEKVMVEPSIFEVPEHYIFKSIP